MTDNELAEWVRDQKVAHFGMMKMYLKMRHDQLAAMGYKSLEEAVMTTLNTAVSLIERRIKEHEARS